MKFLKEEVLNNSNSFSGTASNALSVPPKKKDSLVLSFFFVIICERTAGSTSVVGLNAIEPPKTGRLSFAIFRLGGVIRWRKKEEK